MAQAISIAGSTRPNSRSPSGGGASEDILLDLCYNGKRIEKREDPLELES